MSEARQSSGGGISRREALRNIALAVTAVGTGTIELEAARAVHAAILQERAQDGGYRPKYFNDHEYRTLSRLAEMIIPADGKSGSAVEAGAPEFIDLLCSQNEELARIYSAGMLWLDREMRRQHAKSFVAGTEMQQTVMLDQLAEEARREAQAVTRWSAPEYQGFQDYTTDPLPTLGPGARFFVWVRRMTVDAFYTSEIGIKDVGYQGNGFRTTYTVPEASLKYVFGVGPR